MKNYRKPFNDDTENHTLRLLDYTTGEISGSNPFCDKKEREHIREHAKNRLDNCLNQSLISPINIQTVADCLPSPSSCDAPSNQS